MRATGLAGRIATTLAVVLAAGSVGACQPVGSTLCIPEDTACTAGSSPPSHVPATFAFPASTVALPSTPAPSSTPIPGFEGWTVVSPASVEISVDGPTLVMHLTKRALWFQASRGVLLWTSADGDFRITATVHTARASDPARPPGGDGTVQLAGLMARAQSISENYVQIVVGSDAGGLSVETKSTTNANSLFDGPAWPSAEAELRICRIGTTFTLEKRAVGAVAWSVAATIDRPDLAGPLEVGPSIYSDSPPDLVTRYDGVSIETIAPGGAC